MMKKVSTGFELLMNETDGIGEAFMNAVSTLSKKSALDKKTHELAYISVLVSTRMYSGLTFHIQQAIEFGASIEEIKSALLLPMPVVGIQVTEALPYLADILEK